MAELDFVSQIAKALSLQVTAIGEVMTEIHNEIQKELSKIEQIQFENPPISFVYVNYMYDYNDKQMQVLAKAVSLLINPEHVIEVLHKRQIEGFAAGGYPIGLYSPASMMTEEMVSYFNLPQIPPTKKGKKRTKMQYAQYKYEIISKKAGYGNVDLNLTGNLYRNYDYISVDLNRMDAPDAIFVGARNVSYFNEMLIPYYGEEPFCLSFEEVGLTEEKISKKVEEILSGKTNGV